MLKPLTGPARHGPIYSNLKFSPMVKDDLLRQVEELTAKKLIEQKEEAAEITARFYDLLNEKKSTGNPFPVEALPPKLSAIVNTFHKCYGLPVDYFGLGVLTAASVAIGNAVCIQYKHNYAFPPILYGAIVGNSSIGKTPAINMCLGPIFDLEEKYRNDYEVQYQQWKQDCFDIQISGMKREDPPKPKQRELIINDATTEAINNSLADNPRGLLLVRDELNGWINSLNQYRKGSDLEFWLSVWSNQSVKVNRVGKDALFVKKPFVSVIGGIQPAILSGFAQDGRADNGFLARILFAWPDEMRKPYENDLTPDISIFDKYQSIISNLHHLPHNFTEEGYGDPTMIDLDEAARKTYKTWHKDNTDLINQEESDVVKSILGKMESYLLRLALILSLLDLVIENENPTEEDLQNHTVGQGEILRSIALIQYFKNTALKVIGSLESPVKKLSTEKEAFYEALPEEFNTKAAIEAGEKTALSERTVKRLLNDFTLFRQLGRGKYRKVYL